MKKPSNLKSLLFLILFLSPISIFSQKIDTIRVDTVPLKCLYHVELSSANVNAIKEEDGIIFLATQIGVELYLQNRKIGI